jgi:hypothetical protein
LSLTKADRERSVRDDGTQGAMLPAIRVGEPFANCATTTPGMLQNSAMSTQHYEGWFTDPYAIHEARWFSDGRPTKLVRDGEVESYDEPPPGAPSVVTESLEEDPTATNGSDLIRADDAEQSDPFDGSAQVMEALDSFGQSGLLDVRHPYSEDK